MVEIMIEDNNGESSEHQRWEAVHDDFLLFHSILASDRPCTSPDVCAFLYLDKKFPNSQDNGSCRDIVSAAEHDQIWLRVNDDEIAQLTDADILYLTRCGVFHDDDTGSLGMFV